jgi:hypothetical protein
MMRGWTRISALIPLAALIGACSNATPTDTNCLDIGIYGIRVKTFDAATGAPVSVQGTAAAIDGSYREEDTGYVSGGAPTAYSLAAERAGRYRLSITVPGYQVWSQDNVIVRQGVCHVEPVAIDAQLAH